MGWGMLGGVREGRDCLKVQAQAQGAHFSGHACSEVLQIYQHGRCQPPHPPFIIVALLFVHSWFGDLDG